MRFKTYVSYSMPNFSKDRKAPRRLVAFRKWSAFGKSRALLDRGNEVKAGARAGQVSREENSERARYGEFEQDITGAFYS